MSRQRTQYAWILAVAAGLPLLTIDPILGATVCAVGLAGLKGGTQ